jgi:hypothetical protein
MRQSKMELDRMDMTRSLSTPFFSASAMDSPIDSMLACRDKQ